MDFTQRVLQMARCSKQKVLSLLMLLPDVGLLRLQLQWLVGILHGDRECELIVKRIAGDNDVDEEQRLQIGQSRITAARIRYTADHFIQLQLQVALRVEQLRLPIRGRLHGHKHQKIVEQESQQLLATEYLAVKRRSLEHQQWFRLTLATTPCRSSCR